MKIYLAGPMRGLPSYNFPEFFWYAHLLRQQGHEVFNPAEIGLPQDNIRAIFAVEMDWLCREAEAVYLIPGWQSSRGARAERALAQALGLTVRELDSFPPAHPLENTCQSGPLSSTTFRAPLQNSPRSRSWDKSSTIPKGGIGQSLRTMPMLWSVIFWSAGLLTAMAVAILAKCSGGLWH